MFRRLHLLASCSTTLQHEAAKLAVIEAKKGKDIGHYNDAVALLRSVAPGNESQQLADPTWASEREKRNNADSKKLENELKQYKNNLIRESIRVGSTV